MSMKRNNDNRKLLRALLITSVIVIAAVTVILVTNKLSVKTEAATQFSYVKYYKSISVSYGDTLWSIAEENVPDTCCVSLNEYINEVKSINNLISDNITAGEKIVIPYYQGEEIY